MSNFLSAVSTMTGAQRGRKRGHVQLSAEEEIKQKRAKLTSGLHVLFLPER